MKTIEIMPREYRIFISHSWSYDEYQRIINFLERTPNFYYRNFSVSQERALFTKSKSALEKALHSRIKLSQIILVPAGMEINYREFILFELETAQQMKKPIIGIIPRGQKNIPKIINEIACETVGWSAKRIVKAIDSYSL